MLIRFSITQCPTCSCSAVGDRGAWAAMNGTSLRTTWSASAPWSKSMASVTWSIACNPISDIW